jgi:quinohemoprotein ethanol dehydrogenase
MRSLAWGVWLLAALGCGAEAWAGDRDGTGADWYSHGGSHAESNYSRLDQINRGTLGRLSLAWSLDLPGEVSLEATPLAIGGTLYFTGSASDVYAVDARSGRVLWKFDPQPWKYRPEHLKLIWGINRGVAYSHGRIFVGTQDGRLIALDAHSGRLLWSVSTLADDSLQTISGAPWAIKGKVLIGNGGADFGARGYVTAYDERSGKQLWRFYTVPGDPAKGYEVEPFEYQTMKMAAATWNGEWWKVGGGGGTVWDNMTYDPQLNRIYIGVGNAGPWNPRVRSPGGGDNLFIASIVALDANTGHYLWHYQANPSEAWDYKNTSNMISAELSIEGKPRKVLMQSPTNGFFYVIDRLTGRLISAQKTGKVTWADHIDLATGRPVENDNIRYQKGPVEMWPSPWGTHDWQGMSFDPQTGSAYIPYMQLGARFTDEATPTAQLLASSPIHFGNLFLELLVRDPEDNTGALLAWDPVAQRARWKVPHPSSWNGGVLSTGGGLVFQGTADGDLSGYDAADGSRLWSFDCGLGIIASPISYSVGGKQYLSLLVGYGGATPLISELSNRGWKFGAQPRRLLTFALDGGSTLPPTAPRDYSVHALDDPTLSIDPQIASTGRDEYQAHCSGCHGRLLLSAGAPAPDLRESTLALHYDSFRSVVAGGVLKPQLMPQFGELSERQLLAIFAYIRAGARDSLATGVPKPATQPTPDVLQN